jgi:hypothetical protein
MAGYLYVLPIQLQIHSKISAMNMKRCLSACILLMLSLEGALLVAGRPSAASAAATTIRLPSDTQGTYVMHLQHAVNLRFILAPFACA